jgi:gluconokinase
VSEPRSRNVAVVVMGVSGSGKTTVARELAEHWHDVFIEADDLHSASEINKMASGHPLDDDDRLPWLRRVGERIHIEEELGHRPVTACSALKRGYRDIVREYDPDTFFVLLNGSIEFVRARLMTRRHPFMPASLLESQFATLEPLQPDESGITVDLASGHERIVEEIAAALEKIERTTHRGPRS